MARRGRTPSRAEIELWRSVLRDTVPLPGRVLPALPDEAPPASAEAPQKPARPAKRAAAQPARPAPPPAAAPPLELGRMVGVDKRQAERLRRGRTEIEARIDLHGMTQAEAHRRLAAFIEASAAAGRRMVLVITGKGLTGELAGRGPGKSQGVLREAVPRWLNEPALRARIVAVTHAQPKDGGQGALYVLLKRGKSGRGTT